MENRTAPENVMILSVFSFYTTSSGFVNESNLYYVVSASVSPALQPLFHKGFTGGYTILPNMEAKY
jgi:hypothetical protein